MYEEIPVRITRKENINKPHHSEYKELDKSTLVANREYASLSRVTSLSRTSLSSNDVTSSTKRHGIIIPSLSEDRCAGSLQSHLVSEETTEQSLMTGEDEKRNKFVCQQTPKIPRKGRNDVHYKQSEKTAVESKPCEMTESSKMIESRSKQKNKRYPKYENVVFKT